MANAKTNKNLLIFIVIIVIGFVAYGALTMPDNRTAGQRIGDAVDALPQGVDKAARQLEDRTPGEKLGDAVKDAGEDIKRNTNTD
jgi:hypothetical protein